MENFKKLTKQPLFLPIFCMILVLLINLIKSPAFFSIKIQDGVLFGRLIDILNRGSEIAILAVGQTLVVAVSAGTDISVGSVMSLSACSCCMLLAGMVPMGIGMLFGVLMGGVCGAMNGALVSKLKIQPMVATLILYTAARAIGLLLCNNQITYIRYEPYKYLGNFLPGCPIPTPVFVAALVILIVTILLKKTALGLYIQSVGINSRAARISGINSDVICFICYLVCGICAGIAGIVASSRIYSADSNNIGLNYEAILAVALGGNSLGGGKFNLAGSIIGAYTIQAITTTLLAMGVSTDKAPVFKAIIVIIIVVVQAPAFKAYMAARKAQKAHIKEAA